jgi:hypothetical protein
VWATAVAVPHVGPAVTDPGHGAATAAVDGARSRVRLLMQPAPGGPRRSAVPRVIHCSVWSLPPLFQPLPVGFPPPTAPGGSLPFSVYASLYIRLGCRWSCSSYRPSRRSMWGAGSRRREPPQPTSSHTSAVRSFPPSPSYSYVLIGDSTSIVTTWVAPSIFPVKTSRQLDSTMAVICFPVQKNMALLFLDAVVAGAQNCWCSYQILVRFALV